MIHSLQPSFRTLSLLPLHSTLARLSHGGLLRPGPLNSGPRIDPGVPSRSVRELLLPAGEMLGEEIKRPVPRDEREIRIRHSVADKIFLADQDVVEDAKDATDFLDVALDGARDLLGVEVQEPGGLAEVRSLA